MDNGNILKRFAATSAVLLAAVVTARGAAQQGEDAEVTAAPSPRACLPHPAIDRTKILNDRNIVFVTYRDEIYNNELPKQCPSLNRRSLVNYGVANGRICAGDRFQVLWESTPGSFLPGMLCQLGNFVPITEDELADLTAMTAVGPERNQRRRSKREAVTAEPVALPPAEPVESRPAEPAIEP